MSRAEPMFPAQRVFAYHYQIDSPRLTARQFRRIRRKLLLVPAIAAPAD